MPLNLHVLADIAPESVELARIKTELGAADDASARQFLPSYRALVGKTIGRPMDFAKHARLSKKHGRK